CIIFKRILNIYLNLYTIINQISFIIHIYAFSTFVMIMMYVCIKFSILKILHRTFNEFYVYVQKYFFNFVTKILICICRQYYKTLLTFNYLQLETMQKG